MTKAETGVTKVYTAFGITPSPTFNSNTTFQPIPTFITGESETEQYYFHPDHLGSSNYITNIAGDVSQHMEYFAFGETFVEEHKNSINSPYKFNGKELDEESGLYYYGARYYDPRISIWASVDPLAEKFAGRSSYEYCFNNPVNLVDPTGMGPTPNWSAFISNLNALIKNANDIFGESGVSGSTGCINYMVSCINSLYTNGRNNTYRKEGYHDFTNGVKTSVDLNNLKLLGKIVPTYKGAEIKIQGISSKDLKANITNLNTHISEKLNELTPSNGISVYAVGITMKFHCTLVIVSKDPNFKDESGKSGTNENPMYIFIQDDNLPETFDKESFENGPMHIWFRSGRSHYRRDRDGDTSKVPKAKFSSDLYPEIYQLFIAEPKKKKK